MAGITLKNISKRWGSFVGVDNFNLEIADREFLVLLGPSGCGKTTTMRMVAGLEAVTEGEIYIGDRLVNKLEPKDRDVAMVFQSHVPAPRVDAARPTMPLGDDGQSPEAPPFRRHVVPAPHDLMFLPCGFSAESEYSPTPSCSGIDRRIGTP